MKVYIADVHTLEDAGKFETLYQLADAARKKKVDGYRFQKDKMLSLGAGVLLQKAFRDAGITGARLTATPTGKPYLENYEKYFFSLSHSGSKVLCAIAEIPIGCDIEEMKPQSFKLMNRIFTPEERNLFTDKSPDEQLKLFYTLWTGKESYLKMTGEGIAEIFHDISIHVPFESQVIRGQIVTFLEIPCDSKYKAAVCVKGMLKENELQFRNVDL
jgi:4'-phosphopantetheinyl transferase